MDDAMDDLDMEVPSLSGSFLNQEASVSMESVPVEQEEEEDDDLFYVEPRRPSLDLGLNPMETGALLYVERPKSPAESYLSMRSEGIGSSVKSSEEDRSCTKINLERTESFSSCYSVDSDDCEIRTKVKSKDVPGDDKTLPELKETHCDVPQPHLNIPFVFKAICKVLQELRVLGLEQFRGHLWHRYPQSFSGSLQTMDIVDIVDKMLECYSPRVSLQITKAVLLKLEQQNLVDYLEDLEIENEVHYDLRERLKKTYGVFECSGGEERPLSEVYTDVRIVLSRNYGPIVEHEVMSIKKPELKKVTDLSVEDLVSPRVVQRGIERVILLRGVAGSGKSVVVRKFIHDWCNNRPSHINLVFAFTIKDLMQAFGDSEISFLDILHHFYPETKRLHEEQYSKHKRNILYIFDGVEEIVEEISFQNTPYVFKIDKPAKLYIVLASILRGQLMRSGFFLFTARPIPNFSVPYDTKHHDCEVLGFKDDKKEEYFKKRFKDPNLASRVIAYVKSSRTLEIMSFLPLFSSLLSDWCQSVFDKKGPSAELPKGITHMYTRLFLALYNDYYKEHKEPIDKLQFIMTLGKRAFLLLEKGKYFMCLNYRNEVEVPLDEREAAAYMGFSTFFFTRPMPFVDEKTFSFAHPTVQEYLAALYVFLTFLNEDKNIFDAPKIKRSWKLSINKKPIMDLYKNALEKSLLCEDGKLDIFIRFLFGMSNSSNIELLRPFFNPTVKWTSVAEEAAALIRKRMTENQYPARSKNLQLCLEELDLHKPEAKKRSLSFRS